jgi:hypothetical protein
MLAVPDVRPELIKFSARSIAFFFVDTASFRFLSSNCPYTTPLTSLSITTTT